MILKHELISNWLQCSNGTSSHPKSIGREIALKKIQKIKTVVNSPSLLTDVDIFSAARTVTILFASYVDFFLSKSLVPGRKIGGERRVLAFPSDALLTRQVNLTFDVSLGGCCFGVAPVRRRKDAERNRYAGVKVQIDGLSGQRTLLECLSRIERKTRRGLLLLLG